MDKFRVQGPTRLQGEVTISGAKNAALPILFSALLAEEPVEIQNVPKLKDIDTTMKLLSQLGAKVERNGSVWIDAGPVDVFCAPYDLVKTMRASIWALGPLVARFGQGQVSLPGGCAIGTRPVDLFIEGLQALGATMEIDGGYINASAPKGGLIGAVYTFPKVSVGATHVMLMAASLARGTTVIHNAAREPEVVDLAHCLIAMGAKIEGAGTSTITIEGVTSLSGARHRVLPDRIETGTYAMAVAMTGGDVVLEGTRASLLDNALDTLRLAGATISETETGLRVVRNGNGIQPVDVVTEPFPGFPTDLQAQFMALMTRSQGVSHITETIFENRFMHVQELARLGAKISLSGQMARIEGVSRLKGAPVMATDLRASVSLVIAGLVAEGETMVSRVYHLDRGFERLEEKLTRCGALVERVSD